MKPKFVFKNRASQHTQPIIDQTSILLPLSAVEEQKKFMQLDTLTSRTYTALHDTSIKIEDHKDISLLNLENCAVHIKLGSSLYIKDMINCTVIGDIQGSALIHNCINCTFVLSAHQYRMHDSVDCKVYLNISTDAIIEGCSKMAFGRHGTVHITTFTF